MVRNANADLRNTARDREGVVFGVSGRVRISSVEVVKIHDI